MEAFKCFVIMPFSKTNPVHSESYWTNHFENFLKVEIEKIPNLKAHRSKALRGDILKNIIRDLYDSFIVVADLTDYNSNVFYELGIRQSFRYRTITIAQNGTELPFDIGRKGTLFYDPEDPLNDLDFCRNFNLALVDCLQNPDKPDSEVLLVIKEIKNYIYDIPQDLNLLIKKMIMDIDDDNVDKFFPENYKKLEELATNINWDLVEEEIFIKYKKIRKYYKDNYSVGAVLDAFRRINLE